MARRIRNTVLETREARTKLRRGGNRTHYAAIEKRLHLGYRPSLNGTRAGSWELRCYAGNEKYRREVIAIADDVNDADGVNVLSYWQAVDKARERLKENAALGSKAPTVRAIMEDYLAYIDHERKDKLNARHRIEAHVLPVFGDRDAASLKQKEIQNWFYAIADTPARKRSSKKATEPQYRAVLAGGETEAIRRRKSTANRILTTLKAALNRAYKKNDLKCDPVWREVSPFGDVDRARIRFLSLPECQRLINAAEPDFRNLVRGALFTGCRYGELTRLKVADFNPGSRANGSKPVAATITIGESKSGKNRHIFLGDEGVEFFTTLCAGRPGGEPMLRRKSHAWRTSEQATPMKETCKRAKISPPINFHGLRHTYASLALMNGMALFVLARNLGHRDTRMVEEHYGHLARDYEAEMVRTGAPSFGIVSDSNVKVLHG